MKTLKKISFVFGYLTLWVMSLLILFNAITTANTDIMLVGYILTSIMWILILIQFGFALWYEVINYEERDF